MSRADFIMRNIVVEVFSCQLNYRALSKYETLQQLSGYHHILELAVPAAEDAHWT